MRILADFHHGQLFRSFMLTFEKRFGYELYRPIGRKWHTCGYWGWLTHELQIQQFLGDEHVLEKPYPFGLGGKGIGKLSEHPAPHLRNGLITYEAFMDTHFDVLIASMPMHVPLFKQLSEIHPSHPKVVFQIGNNWTTHTRDCQNILNATGMPIDSDINHLNYYPEFEVQFCNNPILPKNKSVSSFLHLNGLHCGSLFNDVEQRLGGWTFKEYGASNRDGPITDFDEAIINKILEANFIWHIKTTGDGYGFVVHEAFACGRPPIIPYTGIYDTQRAGVLMKPGVNCIDASGKDAEQLSMEIIQSYERWNDMSIAAKQAFEQTVNFDEQGQRVKEFLERLV